MKKLLCSSLAFWSALAVMVSASAWLILYSVSEYGFHSSNVFTGSGVALLVLAAIVFFVRDAYVSREPQSPRADKRKWQTW